MKMEKDNNGISFLSGMITIVIIAIIILLAINYIPEIRELYSPDVININMDVYMHNKITDELYDFSTPAARILYDAGEIWELRINTNAPYLISNPYIINIKIGIWNDINNQYETSQLVEENIDFSALYTNSFDYSLNIIYGIFYNINVKIITPEGEYLTGHSYNCQIDVGDI